jgi:AraC-like DNA-binding protein
LNTPSDIAHVDRRGWRLGHGERRRGLRQGAGDGVVARARAFLEANAGAPVRLSEVAAVAGVSPFHLIRCFQREVGMPPHAWLTQIRANRAREMLLAGEAPTAVAYRCGFSDQSHLTRTFRSMFGITPGSYARTRSSGGSARDDTN